MRIKRVTAHAFGPLRDATLELAPGLTVIYGRNESAKSTWHAAIYASICGRRRGAGARKEDRDFADRHRPWVHDGWLVSAEIHLADGRRVELRQDLDRRVDCHARDLDLGTDLSAEIMNDGTPDAAGWLGLDRRSFEATAFVAQARMLDVLKDADGLQSHLQRAAATAGADATAAGALRRIEAFRAEYVGRAQANSVRPLQRAIVAHRAATTRLAGARTRHSDDEQRQVQVQALRAQAAAAQERLRRREAADLFARAEAAGQRAAEAAVLQDRLAAAGAAELVTDVEVAAALAARAGASVAPLVDPASVQVADHELWELARLLEIPGPPRRGRAGAGALIVAGAALAGLGSVALLGGGSGTFVWALAAAVLGLALAVAGVVIRRRPSDAVPPAAARCEELGLPTDPGRLRDLARARAAADRDGGRSAAAAAAAVVALAQRLGAHPAGVEEAEGVLLAWQDGQAVRAERAERHRHDRARLAVLLDGGSLTSLEEQAAAARQRAEATGLHPAEVVGAGGDDADEDLTVLRAMAQEAAERAAAAAGALAERRAAGDDVAEAEEALAHAAAEEARVRSLDDTLARTRGFLATAQERAHRDIAPVLAESVRRRLAGVTAGRYTDVIVDPADLHVEVCGPDRRWRRAELLSHGTAEQVYLLLRIALAEHLARPGEPCPLVLDDVIVHADEERALPLLELLRSAATERQIVLFTHQPRVRDWAARQDPDDHELQVMIDGNPRPWNHDHGDLASVEQGSAVPGVERESGDAAPGHHQG
jgi:uncharacterized protein YhaN